MLLAPNSSGLLQSDAEEPDDRQLYQRLKRIAIGQLRLLPPNQTLSATALVNEAYLKLSSAKWKTEGDIWSNERLLLSLAAETMRQIAIDYFRRRLRKKRGGDLDRVYCDVELLLQPQARVDVLALNDVLDVFERAHPQKALLVKLRYFGGMTMPQCADALKISLPTAERHWRYARAWLFNQLQADSQHI